MAAMVFLFRLIITHVATDLNGIINPYVNRKQIFVGETGYEININSCIIIMSLN